MEESLNITEVVNPNEMVQLLGGFDNIVVTDGSEIEKIVKAAYEDVNDYALTVPEYYQLENYGIQYRSILDDIVVKDPQLLTSAISTNEDNSKLEMVMRALVRNNNTVSIIVIENIDYENVFTKWFTLDAALPAMVRKQHELNISTNGEQYLNGYTNKDKPINWQLCIAQEMGELIDSTPWKHWKSVDGKIDYKNVYMETIDIWHFLLASYIQELYWHLYNQQLTPDQIVDETCKYKRFGFYEFTQIFTLVTTLESHKGDDVMMDNILMGITIQNHLNGDRGTKATSLLIMSLCLIFSHHNHIRKSTNDFIAMYYGKNLLNTFRKDNGYQEGTYKKVWNGKEDNVVLDEILESLDLTTELDIKVLQDKIENELYDRYSIVAKPTVGSLEGGYSPDSICKTSVGQN